MQSLSSVTRKLSFYFSLWSQFLIDKFSGRNLGHYWNSELSQCESNKCLRVVFATPHKSAGSEQIVDELLSYFDSRQTRWPENVTLLARDCSVSQQGDCLLVFKSLPKLFDREQFKRLGLIICDQLDVFWDRLDNFDFVVVTSSPELCQLVSTKTQKVYFIPEFEPFRLFKVGSEQIKKDVSTAKDIMWHGGLYSLSELDGIIPILAELADLEGGFSFWIIGGTMKKRVEKFGLLSVEYRPWSENNLIEASQNSRLALIPARKSLKNSYLKPAARIRRLNSLGVIAIGDKRVPEVRRLSENTGQPTVDYSNFCVDLLLGIYSDTVEINRLRYISFDFARQYHNPEITLNRWLHVLETEFSS